MEPVDADEVATVPDYVEYDESQDVAPPRCKHLKNIKYTAVKQALLATAEFGCGSCSGANKLKKGESPKANKSTPKNESTAPVWMCLVCGHCGCGRSTPSQHARVHHDAKPLHAVAMLVAGGEGPPGSQVWCYGCDADVLQMGIDPDSHAFSKVKDCAALLEKILSKRAARDHIPSAKSSLGIKDSDSVATSTTSSQSSDFAEPSNTKLSPSEFGTGIRGLSNLGNTCFFNSVMQSLCESVQLRRHLLQLGTPAIASKPHLPEGTMLRALRDFFRSIWSASSVKAIVTPSGMLGAVVRANPSLGGGRQQDAHELFRCVVNAVRDEALKFEKEERAQTLQDEVSGWNSEQVEQWFRSIGLEQPDEYLANVASSGDKWTGADLIFMIKNWKATESNALRARLGMKSAAEGKLFVRAMTAIKDGVRVNQSVAEPLTLVDELFGGQLCSTVRCLACHQVSVRRDPFFDLSLAITPPITESTRPRLTPTRAPSAGAGKSSLTVATKSTSISALQLLKSKMKAAKKAAADAALASASPTESAEPAVASSSDVATSDSAIIAPRPVEPTPSADTVVSDNACSSESSAVPIEHSIEGEDSNAEPNGPETSTASTDAGAVESATQTFSELSIVDSTNISIEPIASVDVVDSNSSDVPPALSPRSIALNQQAADLRERALNGADMAKLGNATITLHEALCAFVAPELLTGDNLYSCENCGKVAAQGASAADESGGPCDVDDIAPAPLPTSIKREAVKYFRLEQRIPPVLALSLKRFTATRRGVEKVAKHVVFPRVLDMSDFVAVSGDSGARLGGMRYKLYAVVVQSGGMGGGHYIAYVRKQRGAEGCDEGEWYYFSDSMVKAVNWSTVENAQAYMLFYEQM